MINENKEEEQNYVLKYIASVDRHVSYDEISGRFNITLHRASGILQSLARQYFLGRDKFGYYYIPDEKMIQPLKKGDDPCARKVEATIQNMGVAINAKDEVMDRAKPLLADNQYED